MPTSSQEGDDKMVWILMVMIILSRIGVKCLFNAIHLKKNEHVGVGEAVYTVFLALPYSLFCDYLVAKLIVETFIK